MTESWTIDGEVTPPSGELDDRLRARITSGRLEISLTSTTGRSLMLVTNTERAMVIVRREADDQGEHAATPAAEGYSGGFVLANGQHDEYLNEDTVPLDEALRIIVGIVASGSSPDGTTWVVDR